MSTKQKHQISLEGSSNSRCLPFRFRPSAAPKSRPKSYEKTCPKPTKYLPKSLKNAAGQHGLQKSLKIRENSSKMRSGGCRGGALGHPNAAPGQLQIGSRDHRVASAAPGGAAEASRASFWSSRAPFWSYFRDDSGSFWPPKSTFLSLDF